MKLTFADCCEEGPGVANTFALYVANLGLMSYTTKGPWSFQDWSWSILWSPTAPKKRPEPNASFPGEYYSVHRASCWVLGISHPSFTLCLTQAWSESWFSDQSLEPKSSVGCSVGAISFLNFVSFWGPYPVVLSNDPWLCSGITPASIQVILWEAGSWIWVTLA